MSVANETVNKIIQDAADAGITNVTIEGITLTTDGEGNPVKADVAGLELFENIPVEIVPGENGQGKAIISYAFGIKSIAMAANGLVTVTATVERVVTQAPATIDETPDPTIAEGVTILLLNGENEIGRTRLNASASSVTITSEASVLEDMEESVTGSTTLQLNIKATNNPPELQETPAQ